MKVQQLDLFPCLGEPEDEEKNKQQQQQKRNRKRKSSEFCGNGGSYELYTPTVSQTRIIWDESFSNVFSRSSWSMDIFVHLYFEGFTLLRKTKPENGKWVVPFASFRFLTFKEEKASQKHALITFCFWLGVKCDSQVLLWFPHSGGIQPGKVT